MRAHGVAVLVLLMTAFLALPGCTGRETVYRDVYPTLTDGRYDSEFPYRGCSEQLEQISESIKMVSSIAYYRSYTFTYDEQMTRARLTPELLERKSKDAVYLNSTASGTATVISSAGRQVVFLTCAHVVDFEDTVVSFYVGPDHRTTPFIKSYAVKEKQTNYVAVLPEGGELEILAMDRAADLAILGKRFISEPPLPIPVFPYPLGRARDLEWGTFVYLFGYPSGYRMVTKGIVSNPNRDRKGSFLVDAMFSRGFSGGVALAIRDGVPNFELVGIIKLVSAHTSYVLTPGREDGDVVYDPSAPYNGPVYVEQKTEIESGITQAVSSETVREFLESSRPVIARQGYTLSYILRSSSPGQP